MKRLLGAWPRAWRTLLGIRAHTPGAFTVHVRRDQGGLWWADIEEMPNVAAIGEDLPGAVRNLSDAIEVHLMQPRTKDHQ